MKSKITNHINQVTEQDWNDCANLNNEDINPFCSYGFLSALEESGCATAETGWLPQHIIIEDDLGQIVGVMPLYLKNHSQGEYVFDHSWANAFQQAGGEYYPKLQSSIPFSPVTGPRLLGKTLEIRSLLLESAVQHAKRCDVSSLHFTFIETEEVNIMQHQSLLHREDQQFHWLNEDYKSFDEFLTALSSRKRKNILKERRGATQNGISIEIIAGDDIKEHHWDHYYDFYLNTSNRKWGRPYLNRDFFSILGDKIPDNLVLIMAKRDERFVAGALNLVNENTLFGRYWGAIEHHKFLHFEVCYYQAIEYAIKHKLKKVEAGAQGEHKLARGYLPTITNSAHWIANPSFRDAIKNYLTQERKAVEQDIDYLKEFTPFKKS